MKSLKIECGGQKTRLYIDGREAEDILSVKIEKDGPEPIQVVIVARVTGEVQVGS